jgi:hypothetical protein
VAIEPSPRQVSSYLQAVSFGPGEEAKVVIQKYKVEWRIAVQDGNRVRCLFSNGNTGQPLQEPLDAHVVIVQQEDPSTTRDC